MPTPGRACSSASSAWTTASVRLVWLPSGSSTVTSTTGRSDAGKNCWFTAGSSRSATTTRPPTVASAVRGRPTTARPRRSAARASRPVSGSSPLGRSRRADTAGVTASAKT
ncbi:MAG: hypothetical protein R3F59_19785 [Myxococcota bacterium]